MRKHLYTLALSASVFGFCAAFSPAANAATVSITNEIYTSNAPQEGDAAPLASPAPINFEQGVTGISQAGLSSSPYVANTNYTGVGDSWLYNVISSGGGGVKGSAVYNVDASTYTVLWGTPDYYNQIDFYDGLGGTGNLIGTFTGTNLGCYNLKDANNCDSNRYDLVTFGVDSGVIGSVVLSDTNGSAAFEFGTVATPLPAALPLFGTGLAGLGLLAWRRKRKAAATAA